MVKKAPPPDHKAVVETMKLLEAETSDRAVALIGAAILDDAIEVFIRARMIADKTTADSLLNGVAPLGSFAARIKLAFAVGWIGAVAKQDMDYVRDIRNEFAHIRLPMSFEDARHRNRCNRLALPRHFETAAPDWVKNARSRYATTCALLSTFLVGLEVLPIKYLDDATYSDVAQRMARIADVITNAVRV